MAGTRGRRPVTGDDIPTAEPTRLGKTGIRKIGKSESGEKDIFTQNSF